MKNNETENIRAEYVNDTDWYRFDLDVLCRKLGTDAEKGLTDEAVKAKKALHGKNDIFPADQNEKDNAPKTAFSVLSVLLIISLILAGFLLGDKTSVFGVVLTVAGYATVLVMFLFAKRLAANMAEYSIPEIRVIRNGKTYRINQKGLVQGDLIYLSEGDLVPCDGRIVSSYSLKVLEKNISGGDGVKDADFENKLNGLDTAEQRSMVFARSAISSGSCFVIVCDTGSHTLAVRRGIKAKATGNSTLEIFNTVTKISRVYSIICSVVVFAITALSYIKGGEEEIFSTFLLMLSVAASSYCELICAIAYIAVSYGISPIHEKDSVYNTGIIIKNLSAVNRLRNLNCLMVPKTAGICEKHIEAEKVFTNDRELDITEENADKLRRTVYIALSTFGGRENHAKKQTSLTAEQDAVTELADKLGYTIDDVEKTMIPLDYLASDGEQLFDTALVIHREQYMICLRGSVTQVVNRCSRRISNGTPVPLSADGVNDLLKRAKAYESIAYRVIAIATKPSKYNNLDRANTQDDLCFEGFIVMREPFSPACSEAVSNLEKLGVKTVMFCDDMTAQSIHLAKHIGICRDDGQMLSAPEFVSSNINIIDLKMMSYRLFRGMSNRQKRYIADSYLAAGEHVGVIGQHLFDVSLMNGTDTVGFAANLTLSRKKSKSGAEIKTGTYSSDGSEALKRAADVVISPADRNGRGGINAAYDAILTARKVCNNIRNILFYIIASNSARLLIALISTFFNVSGMNVPQMIFSGIAVDLLAVVCMCNGNNKKMAQREDLLKKASESRLKTVIMSVVSGLLCGALAIGGSLFASAVGKDASSASAVCFTSMILLQLFGCLELMRGKYGFFDGLNNVYIICSLILLEYLLLSAFFPEFFAAYLTGTAYISGIAICLVPAALFFIVCAVIRFIQKRK